MNDSERNLKGKEFEKNGELEKAIEVYEQNVSLKSNTPHPYTRLAAIYKKQGKIEDEIRVLRLGLSMMEQQAKKYGWKEGTKQYEKVEVFSKKLGETMKRQSNGH